MLQISSLSLIISISFFLLSKHFSSFWISVSQFLTQDLSSLSSSEIIISGITLNSLFSLRRQISTCVSIKDMRHFSLQIGHLTFASVFSFCSAEKHTEVHHASFVIDSFNIVVVCTSLFSETEYEDKLAWREMNETHLREFAATGLVQVTLSHWNFHYFDRKLPKIKRRNKIRATGLKHICCLLKKLSVDFRV